MTARSSASPSLPPSLLPCINSISVLSRAQCARAWASVHVIRLLILCHWQSNRKSCYQCQPRVTHRCPPLVLVSNFTFKIVHVAVFAALVNACAKFVEWIFIIHCILKVINVIHSALRIRDVYSKIDVTWRDTLYHIAGAATAYRESLCFLQEPETYYQALIINIVFQCNLDERQYKNLLRNT